MTKLPVFDTLFSVSCLSPPCRPPFFETSVVVEADPWAWYANKGPCPTSDASPVFLRVKTYATNEKNVLWTIENMLKNAKRFGWFVLHTSWILDVCQWAFGELISRFLILVQWAKQHHIGIALKLQIMSLWHAWFKLVGLHREVSSNSNSRVCTPKLLWFKHNKQWSFHRFRTAFRNTILKIKIACCRVCILGSTETMADCFWKEDMSNGSIHWPKTWVEHEISCAKTAQVDRYSLRIQRPENWIPSFWQVHYPSRALDKTHTKKHWLSAKYY